MTEKLYPPIHPGEVLMEDFIDAFGITQNKLAVSIGVPQRRINEIVDCKRAITADTGLRFDPGRWLDQPRRSPSEFVPFGGGKHRCLGSGLAVTELTVMLSRLLARGEFVLERPATRAVGLASMRLDPGVVIAWDVPGSDVGRGLSRR